MQIITDDIAAINETIAEKIGQQKFRIWFKNSTRMSLADGYLKVGVPNLFIGSWIENHFANEINEAVRLITGQSVKVIFNIDPELSGSQRRTQLNSQAQSVEKIPQRAPHQHLARSIRQKPAPLKLNLDTFVVGSSNQLAYNAAKTIVNEKQSPFNPLFIHGGCGLGKTHLLQGICNDWAKKRPGAVWYYVSAEEFTNQYILALKTKKLDAFRKRFRHADLLAIDDVHFLANKSSTQEEFLHTFNSVDMAGKQVVLASDAHPKMIGQLSESLVNRFVSGMVVKIDTPDFATRCSDHPPACRRDEQGACPSNVIEYIAQSLKTNVRELEGALLKLAAFASLCNEKISLRMAKQVLDEHISRTDPIVHISDIETGRKHVFRPYARRYSFIEKRPHRYACPLVQHVPCPQAHKNVVP